MNTIQHNQKCVKHFLKIGVLTQLEKHGILYQVTNIFIFTRMRGTNSKMWGMCNTFHQTDLFALCAMLPDKSIDMIFADLPYGMTNSKWDSIIPLEPMWEQFLRVTKTNGAIVLTASQPFTSMLVCTAQKYFNTEWTWEKNAGSNFGSVKYVPMKEHESVLVFSKDNPKYYPIFQDRAESGLSRVKYEVNYRTGTDVYSKGLNGAVTSKRPDKRYPRSIQKFNRERGIHPNQKPVDLVAYFIKTYTDPLDIVLDPCCGSGTTAIAAAENARNFIVGDNGTDTKTGKAWVEIAKQRWVSLLDTDDKTEFRT